MDISILDTPFFGLILILVSFNIGVYLFKKTNLLIFNPLLVGIIISIGVISYFKIPLDYFKKGGDYVTFLLAPAIVSFALLLYRQFERLKKNFFIILIGALVGSITSILSIIYFGKFLGIDEKLLLSFIPKSTTTAIAIEVSSIIGGVPAITILGTVITGITGNASAIIICKICGIKNPVAKGLGIGISSHAIGTSKALEIGEIEGAMSALSLVIMGITTFTIAPLFLCLLD